MENHLSPLKSLSDTGLSPSSVAWVADLVLGYPCGLGLFLLLLPCLHGGPSSPAHGQKGSITCGGDDGEAQEREEELRPESPLGTVRYCSPPGNSCVGPPFSTTSGLEGIIWFLSQWGAAAQALLFPTSRHSTPQREPPLHPPPEASLWGDPVHRQIKGGDPTFINPDVQMLLEMLLPRTEELKLWKEEEKEGAEETTDPAEAEEEKPPIWEVTLAASKIRNHQTVLVKLWCRCCLPTSTGFGSGGGSGSTSSFGSNSLGPPPGPTEPQQIRPQGPSGTSLLMAKPVAPSLVGGELLVGEQVHKIRPG
ncbi:PREDICTED: uncharacterized protein LOC105816081 [Propithecus coquereli]|uniref:uncharacterized protein LOC105816081 n=1 Tax=Propithecus coquereli TaxID=379532 RepID=UPI00063F52DD|nr:PREDICTED: uncharacterized protein LOC105816081 [Propithecus coquereli]